MSAAILPAPGLGRLRLTARDGRLATIDILSGERPAAATVPDEPVLREAAAQLTAYLAGRLRRFDLPLAPPTSPFQARVRAAMMAIGWGEVGTYGGIAQAIGSSARAVGGACGRNPLPVVVPCHRVLAAGGGVGGFSASGGLATKRFLLALEGVTVPG